MCHTSKKINYPSTLLQWTKHKIFSHLTPPLFLNQTKARGCFNIMYRTSKPLIKCLIRILIRYTRSHLFKDNPKQRRKKKETDSRDIQQSRADGQQTKIPPSFNVYALQDQTWESRAWGWAQPQKKPRSPRLSSDKTHQTASKWPPNSLSDSHHEPPKQ